MLNELELEFFKFIYKRQLIWYKRFILKESKPWTNDKILQTYKIINIYRELDKCTDYILRKLQNVNSREKLFLNIVFYRFFNRINLYEELGIEPFNKLNKEVYSLIIKKFELREKNNQVIFNNAYLISSGTCGQKKYISVMKSIKKLSENIERFILLIDKVKTPRESLNIIQKIEMVGPFLACEIWTDLSYFNFFKQEWSDDDFVNIGPGAKWGLEILKGKKLNLKQQEEYLTKLCNKQSCLKNIHTLLYEKFSWEKIKYKKAFTKNIISRTNIEGSLCEFRKYWNIKNGIGRRKYFKESNYFKN